MRAFNHRLRDGSHSFLSSFRESLLATGAEGEARGQEKNLSPPRSWETFHGMEKEPFLGGEKEQRAHSLGFWLAHSNFHFLRG